MKVKGEGGVRRGACGCQMRVVGEGVGGGRWGAKKEGKREVERKSSAGGVAMQDKGNSKVGICRKLLRLERSLGKLA